jgi:hypothetical protein
MVRRHPPSRSIFDRLLERQRQSLRQRLPVHHRILHGNVLETYTSMPNGLPRGSTYHSIPAKVGVGLANDEYIVYDLS